MAEFKMAAAPMTLETFVRNHKLPAVVEVVEGIYSTHVTSDFSLGDVVRILPPKGQSRPRGYDPEDDLPPFDVIDIVTEGTGEVTTYSVYSDLFVSPVQSTHETAFQPPMDLRELLRKRGAVFPVNVVVAEGQFKSNNVQLKVGSQLVVYRKKSVKVVLAESGGTKLAIRGYQGRFRLKPKRYLSASDLYASAIDKEVKVLRSPETDLLGRLDTIRVNDILTPTNVVGKTATTSRYGEVDFLLCMRKDTTTGDRVPVRIPLFSDCLFEECVDAGVENWGYRIWELVTMFPELPINAELMRSDPNVSEDCLSTMGTISVNGEYDDIYLVARELTDSLSDEAVAFEMPLHADIKVKLCQRGDHTIPKLVAEHQAIEILPADVYKEKLSNVVTYETLLTPPPLPPRPANLPHPSKYEPIGQTQLPPNTNPPKPDVPAVPLRRASLLRPPSTRQNAWRQTLQEDPRYAHQYQLRQSRPLSESDSRLQQWSSKTLPAQATPSPRPQMPNTDGANTLVQGMSKMFGAVSRKVGQAKAHLRNSKEYSC